VEIITLTKENIDQEHICCAMSAQDQQVISKKEWLKEQFEQGLIFSKMNVRGKCFIEYMPIEKAWISLEGDQLMFIHCLWVSGKYQGLGYAKALLNDCIKKSQLMDKRGLVMVSSKKKKPFVMDYNFLRKHGFQPVDSWNDYVLMAYTFDGNIDHISFQICDIQEDGLVLYYTYQCPFHIKYVALLKEYCHDHNIPLIVHHIKSREAALLAPTPLSYSLFYHKKFITREVLLIKKFEKIWRKLHE